MKGTADSFFGFLGKQLSESREMRRELRAENREEEREIRRGFIRIFGYMVIGMFVLAAIMFIVSLIRGDSDETATAPAEPEQTVCHILPSDGDAPLHVWDFTVDI